MGIQLDWEVESDLGREAIAEDAQVVQAQQKRSRRWRFGLIAAALIVIVVGSIAWYRAKIVRDEKLRTLIATVEAEALALRLGDEAKFMKLQGADEAWRDEQRANFDAIQSLGVSINVTGHILNQQMTDQEAEITLEIVINDEPLQAVWLYEYTDSGWKHVATQQEPWVEQTVERYPFTYTYNAVHQPKIDELDTLLTGWWAVAADQTGIDAPIELSFRIDSEARAVKWTDSNEMTTLIIPLHMLQAADLAAPDDRLRVHLAARFSKLWAKAVVSGKDISGSDFWLLTETTNWLSEQFGVPTATPSIFTTLAPMYGSDVFKTFLTRWDGTGDGNLVLQQTLFSDIPENPDAAYFEGLLNWISALNTSHPGVVMSPTSALANLVIESVSDSSSHYFPTGIWLQGSKPGSFHVEHMEQFRDVIWVTTLFQRDESAWGAPGETRFAWRYAYIPFRKVDGNWKLASIREEDWGELIVEQSEYVTFSYPEIEADLYRNTVQHLEAAYLQAVEDFDLTETPHIDVSVRTDFMSYEDDPALIDPKIFPARMGCCYDNLDISEDDIRLSLAGTVYYEVFHYLAGPPPMSRQYSYLLENALITWAFERHGWLRESNSTPALELPIDSSVPVPSTLDEIWQTSGMMMNEGDQYRYRLGSIGATELVSLVMERYGAEAFPLLVQTLRRSLSVTEWLQVALLIDATELRQLEDDWRERYHAVIRQQFGEAAFQP